MLFIWSKTLISLFTFVYTFVNMVERFKKILEHYRISPSQLAEKVDVQRSNISHILSERNKPSLDLIQKILTTFPDLESDWLLFGKGEMLKQKEVKEKKPDVKPVVIPAQSELSFQPKKEEPVTELPKAVPPVIVSKTIEIEEKNTPSPAESIKTETKKKSTRPVRKQTHKIIILNEDNTFREFYPEDEQ